jgi:hypothetical protein
MRKLSTRRDPQHRDEHGSERGPALKAAWSRLAIERMATGHRGNFGYSLFSVSRADLIKIRELHLDYVRAMQRVISESEGTQCVGLYCSQLLDLRPSNNAPR